MSFELYDYFENGTEAGEEPTVVEVEDMPYLPDGLGVVSTCAPDLIHVANGLLRQFMQPDRVLLHGEDVDIDSLFLPQTVVVVLFQHPRTTVAHLGIKEEIVGIRLVVLQGEPLW